MIRYFALISLLALCGCYDSSGSRHEDDAADTPDAADTAQDDARPDEISPDAAPPDIVPDTTPDHGPDTAPDIVPDGPPPGPYVLHEWGVISRGDWGTGAHGPSPEGIGDSVDKPVIYLYTDDGMDSLDIKVSFATGLADETWPMLPAGPVLDWSGLRVSRGSCETTPFPYPWEDPMCEICNLSICVVEDADCITFSSDEGVETTSKLLFYAGPVEDYQPPLKGEAIFPLTDGDAVVEMVLSNESDWEIEDIWLVYREAHGNCPEPFFECPVTSALLAYTFIDSIPPGGGFATELTVGYYEAPLDPEGNPTGELFLPEDWLEMDKKLHEKLVERGLTEAEAAVFVGNWVQAYFGLLGGNSYYVEPLYANGAFAIYFMDREDYDLQFRLEADPAPRQAVRVGMIYDKLPTFNE